MLSIGVPCAFFLFCDKIEPRETKSLGGNDKVEREVNLLIITGMSGAGKTVAVQSLEDLGFFCVDNLPSQLIPKFAELIEQSDGRIGRVALVIDLRSREFFHSLIASIDSLAAHPHIHYQILFLDADDGALVRRYKETRRRHPLSQQSSLLDGIQEERTMLEEIKGRAHQIIDTSHLRPAQLKEKITAFFTGEEQNRLSITFMSFGFKYGVPIDADLVFDVRFLPNPHYVDSLRPLTGKERDVYEYVLKWAETKQFLQRLTDLLTFLFPHYQREGKTQLVVAIGCTGGKHRSVALAEYLHSQYGEQLHASVHHRDWKKDH